MKTDRELVKLAAKAAGIELRRWNEMLACFELAAESDLTDGGFWNPWVDDCHAFRLAVKLGLRIEHARQYAVCYSGSCMAEQFTERWTDDPYAATRRAIVRAAAEIGRSMP